LTGEWLLSFCSRAVPAWAKPRWCIRRCDAINLLLLDSLDEHDPLHRDHVIIFTPREYRMLVPLLAQMGRPVPFAALIDGPFEIGRDRDLFRTHMARARKKIAHLGIVIRPVKGYGYIAQITQSV